MSSIIKCPFTFAESRVFLVTNHHSQCSNATKLSGQNRDCVEYASIVYEKFQVGLIRHVVLFP